MHLALQLVTHNSARFLPHLLESLFMQTDQDWECLIYDAGSSNDEKKKIIEIIAQYTPTLPLRFSEGDNLGFAGAHQKLYQEHSADVVLLVNHDVIFTPTYIAQVRQYLENNPKIGVAAGTILRWEWDQYQRPCFTDAIDSLGLARTRWHKVYDIGSGKPFQDFLQERPALFGISGCLPMYRREALGSTLFDSTYFMYKEDVDVAYRLRQEDWGAAIVPDAVAYHFRGLRASRLHRDVSFWAQKLSYYNHWRNLRRHLSARDWLIDGWAIIPYELGKALFLIFTRPGIFWHIFREKILGYFLRKI